MLHNDASERKNVKGFPKTHPINLTNDGSLANCTDVNGGLEADSDALVVEQNIDVRLKLQTARKRGLRGDQYHALDTKPGVKSQVNASLV